LLIDIVRFKKVEVDEAPEDEEDAEGGEEGEAKKLVVGPVIIWIGVFSKSTSATAAHDVDFRESFYMREIGPQLHEPVGDLDPLVDVVSPLTPALGLRISTKVRPSTSPRMAAAIDSWAFRAITSSSDPRTPTLNMFATSVGLLATFAGELYLTSSIRSNSGLDETASQLSAGGSRLKGSRRGRRAD